MSGSPGQGAAGADAAATDAAAVPFTILVAALGGEGGGVLAQWLVQCGLRAGLPIQATSVPGVAQRTGATSYYIELLREPLPAGGAAPVFALNPSPGRVDVLIASESLEAARMIERGFVAPDRTVLIASTHRVFTTAEKMHMTDGRYDGDRVVRAAQALARRAILFDMDAVATQHRTVLSAVLFGALSGAGVLPWSRDLCESVIGASGRGVEASLAGFARAWALASEPVRGDAGSASDTRAVPGPDAVRILQQAGVAVAASAGWQHALAALPPTVQVTAAHGVVRCHDYQDHDYATRYLGQLDGLVRAAGPDGQAPGSTAAVALDEAARQLALWMCFEDVARVADLKTRAARRARVRREAEAADGDIVRIVEYLKPGVDEIAAMLPRRLGAALLSQAGRRPWMRRLQFGLNIRSSSAWGYLLLRAMARSAAWRPRSHRFAEEHDAISVWLEALARALGAAAPSAAAFAVQLAGLPQVLKGYGDTQMRGRRHYARLWAAHVAPLMSDRSAVSDARWAAGVASLAEAVAATLADPEGLNPASEGVAGSPGGGSAGDPTVRTIRWISRPRGGDEGPTQATDT